VTPGVPAQPALAMGRPGSGGNNDIGGGATWRRLEAVRAERGGGRGAAASPSNGLVGFLSLPLSWGSRMALDWMGSEF
jgi:hypothetical protein